MANPLAIKSQRLATRVLAIQATIALLLSLLWSLDGKMAAASSLVGGLVCIIPNGVFVMYTHRHGGARSAKKIINAFYQGEAIKMLLTAALFASVFIFVPVRVLPLFTTFTGCLLSFPIAGILSGNQKQN